MWRTHGLLSRISVCVFRCKFALHVECDSTFTWGWMPKCPSVKIASGEPLWFCSQVLYPYFLCELALAIQHDAVAKSSQTESTIAFSLSMHPSQLLSYLKRKYTGVSWSALTVRISTFEALLPKLCCALFQHFSVSHLLEYPWVVGWMKQAWGGTAKSLENLACKWMCFNRRKKIDHIYHSIRNM